MPATITIPTTTRHLFVYGTLRKTAGHPMHDVLATHGRRMTPATVPGELYSLGEYPGLVPRQDATTLVAGEVYEIEVRTLEHTLRILDRYEGIGSDEPPPHQYRRELILVTLGGGRQLAAWTYVLNRPPDGLRRIDSGDFSKQ